MTGLVAGPGLARRRRRDRAVTLAASACALVAIAVLALVVGSTAIAGAGSLSLGLLIHSGMPSAFQTSGTGIADAIVGTAILVALASAIALPLGVLTGLFTAELARPRAARAIQFVLDTLNGVPTIVTGVFVFGILVVGHPQSAIAGSIALAIVMLPLIARSTHEMLTVVPSSLREAGLALGVARWRTLLHVVLPLAIRGILVGALLAVARAAGETAPLLLTSSIAASQVSVNVSAALPSLPLTIFTDANVASPAAHAQGWAAALLLIIFVAVVSVGARAALAHGRSRPRGAR